MKKKTILLAVSYSIVIALLLLSCAPAVTEEEQVAPPEEEEVVVGEEEEEVTEEEEEVIETLTDEEPESADSAPTPGSKISEYEDSHFGFDHADTAYAEAVSLGVHWERPHPGPVVWGYIEREEGRYQWEMVDKYVKRAQDYDFNLMLTIWPFADWDQVTCHGTECQGAGFERELPLSRCKPCNLPAYRQFVSNLVERYDGDGNNDMPGLRAGIKYWEVSNEPTMQEGELIFFKGTPEDYLEILKVTYEAVKEADPEAKVLHAGMAGAPESPELKGFWKDVYGSGAEDCFDVANIHSIGSGGEGVYIMEMGKFLARYGIEKPIWITEVQYSEWGLERQNLTEEEWAEVIVRSFVYGFGNGAEKLFYVALKGNPGGPGPELTTRQGQKKKAFYAFKTMVAKIDYFTSVKKISEQQYKFIVNGNPIYVLWGSGSIPDEIAGAIRVTDIYGNETQMDASELKPGKSPVFVETTTGSND
jgi:hypothetical protein